MIGPHTSSSLFFNFSTSLKSFLIRACSFCNLKSSDRFSPKVLTSERWSSRQFLHRLSATFVISAVIQDALNFVTRSNLRETPLCAHFKLQVEIFPTDPRVTTKIRSTGTARYWKVERDLDDVIFYVRMQERDCQRISRRKIDFFSMVFSKYMTQFINNFNKSTNRRSRSFVKSLKRCPWWWYNVLC